MGNKSKYNYQDNLKHGRYTTYYQNGRKKEKGVWKHGKMKDYVHSSLKMVNKKKKGFIKGIGLWTYWYSNGNIEREGYRNNGLKKWILDVFL